ncbi:MAG: hypothetical protein LC808_05040 [Actinobacteria bacterium]|nr:hypothetical protein [Actinomycetota bacterium]
MDAGDAVRTLFDTAAVAKLGLADICEKRHAVHERARQKGRRGVAFIVRSLMHESEVSFLRAILGSRFFVISLFSRENLRRRNLILELGARPGASAVVSNGQLEQWADDLMRRDRGHEYTYEHPLSEQFNDIKTLSIEKTFHEADFFVDLDKPQAARDQIRRFVQLIFGDPYATTTEDEAAMSHAFTAMRESSAVARRVGAALIVDGVLVTVGRNDLPEAGGGQLRQRGDGRIRDELSVEPEASMQEREDVFRDTLRKLLRSEQWQSLLETEGIGGLSRLDPKRIEAIVEASVPISADSDSRVFDLIEFNPTVHAEMSAITAAARRGIPLQDATLWTTTFPCHECTRHIIATGIKKVVYLEPYPKSRAAALFSRQIHLGEQSEPQEVVEGSPGAEPEDIVLYDPFMGIAPRRQPDLFSTVRRGRTAEEIRGWTLSAARKLRESIEPVLPDSVKAAREDSNCLQQRLAVDDFLEAVRQLGQETTEGPTEAERTS